MDQQKRFLLALVLSGAVLVVWQSFFAPPPEDPAKVALSKDGKDAPEQAKTQSGDAGQQGSATTPPTAVAVPKKDIPVQTLQLASKDLTLSVTNAGGRLAGFKVMAPSQYQKAGDLLSHFPADSKLKPLGLTFEKGQVSLPDNVVYEVDEAQSVKGADGGYTKVVLRHVEPGGKFVLEKHFSFDEKHPYTLDFTVSLKNTGSSTLGDQMALDFYGYNDPNVSKSFLDFRPSELEGLCYVDTSMERKTFDSLDKPKEFKGDVMSWAGVGLRYFLYVAIFDKKAAPERCDMSQVNKDYVHVRTTWPKFAINPGESYKVSQQLFLGVKDVDVLSSVRDELSDSVDYGFFKFMAVPLHKILTFLHDWVKNWGLAIILLTLLIKILTWPITHKSYANTERMKEIQPKLDAIRAKYENDQQRLTEETMKLFAENKFNPLGGCLPMVLQMPILYGLYVMIVNSVELYQADFILWYTDLSAKDPYFVLPILMGVVMVVQQKFMMSTSAPNPQTKVMMQVMPIMFTAFMLFLPSGLVLYYFLNLILGVLQQWMIQRKFAKQAEEAKNKPEVVAG